MIAQLESEAFQAMGTSCSVAATAAARDARGARRALAAGRAEVAACERALSRFDRDSDLSRLNAARGEWAAVDERLVAALRVAVRVRDDTEGKFDPTILPALVAAGYDRTFEELRTRPPRAAIGYRAGAAVEVDSRGSRARLDARAAVDLGGIGKGFSATRALWAMREAWPAMPGGLVELGGDIAVWGATPDHGPWRIAVADPRGSDVNIGVLGLEQGGVATSGRHGRRFGPDLALHHLIDPATGTPAEFGPLSATVVGPDAAEAEGHATALAMSGLAEARKHLQAFHRLGALCVPEFGPAVAIGTLPLVGAARSGGAAA